MGQSKERFGVCASTRTDNPYFFLRSEKQFQLRYTNEHGKTYTFPERLYRVSLDCNSLLEAQRTGRGQQRRFEYRPVGGLDTHYADAVRHSVLHFFHR